MADIHVPASKLAPAFIQIRLRILDLVQATGFDASLLHFRVSMLFVVSCESKARACEASTDADSRLFPQIAARMLAGRIEYLLSVGAADTEVEELLAVYDRIAAMLIVMAKRSKLAERASLHMHHFRDGTWNQAQFAEAMVMNDVLPADHDADDAVY